MKINDYGNCTIVYVESGETITLPGIICFDMGSEILLHNGNKGIVSRYRHLRHGFEKARWGKVFTRGWVIQEVIGISIVN